MNTSVLTIEGRRVGWIGRVGDYVELTKPRIALLVLVTVVVAGFVATWGQPNPLALLHAVAATALVAASASAFNQLFESETDARMDRTAGRPLPTGRLRAIEVVAFGSVTLVLGSLYLLIAVNWRSLVFALVTWLLYVAVYTPMKSRTSWNTFVGAIAGAMPVLIGWTAVDGQLTLRAAAIFLVVFLWQFPHFMAIAWMYRHQYQKAGLRMLTVVDQSGRYAGIQAVLGAMALLPVSYVAGMDAPRFSIYLLLSFALGVGQLAMAVLFFVWRTEASSKRLLQTSLVYLPSILLLLMFLPWA